MSIEISTRALAETIDEGSAAVVDVRPVEAYNGWTLQGETRGGHIRSARSLPARWASYLDWIEIVRSKGLSPKQPVIVYGYEARETASIAEHFEKAGYTDVRIYRRFVDEWSSDPKLPMNRLTRHHQLVSAAWVMGLINTGSAPTYEGNRFVTCHVHYRNPADYSRGHIPGAVPLDTLLLESPETWNRRGPNELKAALASLGITHDTTVVLYGRFSFPRAEDPFPGSSAGHLAAMRCAFILLYAGVEDVRVLNGGLQSWLDAGYEITEQATKPVIAEEFGASVPGRPELAVDLVEAKQILRDENSNLVSVRSLAEYQGEVSGYNYIDEKGCIPGSVFGNCGSDAYHMDNYRNLDHTLREYHEILKLWAAVGVTPDKRNSFYCGTGWRGSEAFFNAWLMGWPKISVYDGGWYEWSREAGDYPKTGNSVGEA